jgi:hypothetical protein
MVTTSTPHPPEMAKLLLHAVSVPESRPTPHHLRTRLQIQGVIVSRAYSISRGMRQLEFDVLMGHSHAREES